MVQGIPIVGTPALESSLAPFNVPSPPKTIKPSMEKTSRTFKAFLKPFSVLNSSDLAERSMVPPLCIISATEERFISNISPLIKPLYPCLIPITLKLLYIPVLTTALMAAFIPGASPPLVNTPMVFILFPLYLF